MNILEYKSGFDFADMMKEFDYEYVKFIGSTADGTYMLGVDYDDEMLYMKVPVDEYDGKVRRVAAIGLNQSIILPGTINYLCNSTTQSGKSIKFKRTLSECNIVNQFLDDEFKMEGTKVDMEGFFHKSNFIGFDNGLTIKDSSIEVAHMFGNSKSLKHVIFKNCELSSLVGLVSNSDVESVTFEGCSYVARDDSHLKSYERRLEASGLDDVFGWQTTVVNLKNCDVSLVNELMRLNAESSRFLRELEINITD